MTSVFTQIGGLRAGHGLYKAWNVTWPFARLRVDDSALTLRCLGRSWMLSRDRILRLSRQRGLLSVGLRIDHSLAGAPAPLLFWTFRFRRLQRELESRGYVVS